VGFPRPKKVQDRVSFRPCFPAAITIGRCVRRKNSTTLHSARHRRDGLASIEPALRALAPVGAPAYGHNEFATLFDVHYLPRGLVLYNSLRRVCPDFRLRVLCMDGATKAVLDALGLPSLEAISLDELEAHDQELALVKRTRTRVEYCWTAASAFCLYCLEREPGLRVITYLDADLVFYDDPAAIFAELGDGSVLLTEHRYARRWQWLERDSGRFNVQLVTFRRDARALAALRWWRARCLEWCHDRVEDGRFGDQRYLDDWPERFDGVRVVRHPGAGLGPWSSGRFALELRDGRVLVDGQPLLFHHFHGLRIHRDFRSPPGLERAAGGHAMRLGGREARWSSDFPLTPLEIEAMWGPYVVQLALQTERVLELAPGLRPAFEPDPAGELLRRLALRAPAPLPRLASRARHGLRRLSGGRATAPATAPAPLLRVRPES
jgi:hypothetical protein